MSSCFILPKNFDKEALSLSLGKLLNNSSSKKSNNQTLNLCSPSAFYDSSALLDFNTTDDSKQHCFLTFYTASTRLQEEKLNEIRKDWEILKKIEKEHVKFDLNDNENDDFSPASSIDASIYDNIKSKPKHARASMNDLAKSVIYPANQSNLDEIFIEEEEEVETESDNESNNNDNDSDDNDENNINNNNDQSDDFILQLDESLYQVQNQANNNVLNEYARGGDQYDDSFQM